MERDNRDFRERLNGTLSMIKKGIEGGFSNYDFQKLLKEIGKDIKYLSCT